VFGDSLGLFYKLYKRTISGDFGFPDFGRKQAQTVALDATVFFFQFREHSDGRPDWALLFGGMQENTKHKNKVYFGILKTMRSPKHQPEGV